jgi:hypothetical protein
MRYITGPSQSRIKADISQQLPSKTTVDSFEQVNIPSRTETEMMIANDSAKPL